MGTPPTNVRQSGTGDSTDAGGAFHRIPSRRADRDPSSRNREPEILPSRLFERPSSVLLHGRPRTVVNLALFAFAARTNPDFHWVEIGKSPRNDEALDPVVLGWVSGHRLWRIDQPERFGPARDADRPALSGMIRPDEPPEVLDRLAEFLDLPELAQQILGDPSSNSRPGAVAVANAQDVRKNFSPEQIPSILSAHRKAGFSVLVGCDGTPPRHDTFFDFVFRIKANGPTSRSWPEGTLVCERGVDSGPLSRRRPVRLGDIPFLAEILSRAQGPS